MDTNSQDWKLYFLTIVGWSFHPGHKLHDTDIPAMLEQAANVADQMQLITRKRKWPTGQQSDKSQEKSEALG